MVLGLSIATNELSL